MLLIISEHSTTKAFENILNKIKFAKVDYELDVRSKIYMHFFNVKDSMVICIGRNNLLKVDGRSIINNEEILSKIKRLVSN